MAPTTRRSNRKPRKLKPRQHAPKDQLVELDESHNKQCMLCMQKDISEKKYGTLYQFNDVIVHYFCILLSSKAIQKGTDKEGIWGFLLKDIKSEIQRGSKETCFHCKKVGATISCCGNKCRKVFHLPCGLKNGSMHQFFQSFKSFCQQHRIIQTVDINEIQNIPVQCPICKDNVIPSPLPDSLWAPCCKRNAWFHRDCIQDLALSAGYFFKCPLCNNVEKFKSRMLTLGIYIPSRDASWETVPNAFAELLERHSSCDVTNCLCPHNSGRNFNEESGSWEIILCHTCGSYGTHRLCSSLKCSQDWYCTACLQITANIATGTIKRRKLEISNGGLTENNGVSSSSLNMNLRRSREARESLRIQMRRSNLNTSQQQQGNEPIVISDESDNDSDVQCITYIDPPQPARLLSPPTNGQFPTITSYTSMRGNAPGIINFVTDGNGLQTNLSYHRRRLRNLYSALDPSISIDLTLDD